MPKQKTSVGSKTDYVFGGIERNPDSTAWAFAMEYNPRRNTLALGVSDATSEKGLGFRVAFDVDYNPRRNTLALDVSDATVRVWDMNLQELVIFQGHAKELVIFQGHAKELVVFQGRAKELGIFQGHAKVLA
ncbi:hypothetical protein T484DRAFT_1855580 [Baffinella frigidus]|nr:hypothetical protein T484DRAFT_1855580 [Cryptophyta sp. CCMP2293]